MKHTKTFIFKEKVIYEHEITLSSNSKEELEAAFYDVFVGEFAYLDDILDFISTDSEMKQFTIENVNRDEVGTTEEIYL